MFPFSIKSTRCPLSIFLLGLDFQNRDSEWGSRDQGHLAKWSQGPGTITLGTRTICSIFIGTRDQCSKFPAKYLGGTRDNIKLHVGKTQEQLRKNDWDDAIATPMQSLQSCPQTREKAQKHQHLLLFNPEPTVKFDPNTCSVATSEQLMTKRANRYMRSMFKEVDQQFRYYSSYMNDTEPSTNLSPVIRLRWKKTSYFVCVDVPGSSANQKSARKKQLKWPKIFKN